MPRYMTQAEVDALVANPQVWMASFGSGPGSVISSDAPQFVKDTAGPNDIVITGSGRPGSGKVSHYLVAPPAPAPQKRPAPWTYSKKSTSVFTPGPGPGGGMFGDYGDGDSLNTFDGIGDGDGLNTFEDAGCDPSVQSCGSSQVGSGNTFTVELPPDYQAPSYTPTVYPKPKAKSAPSAPGVQVVTKSEPEILGASKGFLDGSVDIGGVSFPKWGIGALAAGLAFVVMSGKKGRRK